MTTDWSSSFSGVHNEILGQVQITTESLQGLYYFSSNIDSVTVKHTSRSLDVCQLRATLADKQLLLELSDLPKAKQKMSVTLPLRSCFLLDAVKCPQSAKIVFHCNIFN